MSTEDLMNILRELHISIYLGKKKEGRKQNSMHFGTRFFFIQLKNFFKFFDMPQENFTCIIQNMAYYQSESGKWEAPHILMQLYLENGLVEPLHITRNMILDRIDKLPGYLRSEILDILRAKINQ